MCGLCVRACACLCVCLGSVVSFVCWVRCVFRVLGPLCLLCVVLCFVLQGVESVVCHVCCVMCCDFVRVRVCVGSAVSLVCWVR